MMPPPSTGPGQVEGPRAARAIRRLWRGPWPWLVIVLVFFCLPLFVGLGDTDLENDEAIYSYAVDLMLENGDWLTPRSIPERDSAFLEKPPLKFWIVALPIKLGLLPHDEFGQRFWDALFGGIVFLYVFAIGRRLAGPVCGLAAVAILFSHGPVVFTHGLRSNEMEACVMLCYAGGIYHFLAWRVWAPDRPRRHIAAMAVFFVLGFMTKFVAALFLPLVCAAVLLPDRVGRMRLVRDWRAWLATSVAATAVIAPWFVYQRVKVGDGFWAMIFGSQVWQRFTASVDPTHLQPWNYYFSELVHQFRGEGVLVAAAGGLALLLFRAIRSRSLPAATVLVWAALPLTLMSLLTSKLYHYTYPYQAPVALAGGCLVAALLEGGWRLLSTSRARLSRWPGARITAARAAVVLVAVALLPLSAYRNQWTRLHDNPHPLRTMRDCLTRVMAFHGKRGFYVEHESLVHPFYYYFRDLGGWVDRGYAPQDATVYRALYVPPTQQPVLLSPKRLAEFERAVQTDEATLIERAAAKAGLSPDAVRGSREIEPMASVPVPYGIILLPRPFRGCAVDSQGRLLPTRR